MARIRGLDTSEVGLRTRLIYWFVKRALGRIPEPVRVRAHVPKLLAAAARMEMFEASAAMVPADLKQLARVKVAALVGCPF